MRFPRRTKRTLHTAVLGIILALLASACGGGTVTLQGDAASQPGNPTSAVADPASPARVPEADPDTTTSDPGQVTDSDDDDPDGTQITLTDTLEPTVVPEPATPAVVEEVVGTGGARDTFINIEFNVGSTVATNSELDAYIDGSPTMGDKESWLVTELSAESVGPVNWNMRDSHFTLVDSTGQTIEADERFDLVGVSNFSATIKGHDFQSFRLAFPTAELVTDTSGWNLQVTHDDGFIPLLLPLSGPSYARSYPVALRDGQESAVSFGAFPGCSGGAEYQTKIARARIDIEDHSHQSRRVPANERLVAIELEVQNQDENSNDLDRTNCGLVGLWPDFLLNVDGRPTQAFRFDSPSVEGAAIGTIPLVFQIPASATSLELVGGDPADVLASWDITPAPAVGEPGAPLIPFGELPPAEPVTPPGARPSELSTTTLADGGASGLMLLTEFTVHDSIATNAGPDAFVKGTEAIDEDGRTWLIVGLDIESIADINWSLRPVNFVLEDPTGRPTIATEIYDRTGEDLSSARLDGLSYLDVTLAFETDGLITDPTGWSVRIDNEEQIPLPLPLAGPTPESEFPFALETPITGAIDSPLDVPGCSDGGLLSLTIDTARVSIEESTRIGQVRITEAERIVAMEVSITNEQADSNSNANCGLLGLWPEFLLDVDGRLTQAFSYDKPSLDSGETGVVELRFAVPTESQTVALVGGADLTVVGAWQLKDASQVLTDFDADQVNNRTTITLDETLLFAFGESSLQQSAFAPLTRVASVVNTESTGDITIVGHTDAIGDEASNQTLSLGRAEAVAQALIEAGVDADRLVVTGQGETQPVAPNENDDGSDNPAGRAENRRVEISFATNE